MGELPDYAIAANRNQTFGFRDSPYDIYRHKCVAPPTTLEQQRPSTSAVTYPPTQTPPPHSPPPASPWRAPGYAPVADACGLAGGTPWAAMAPEEGQYVNTTHASHGMRGVDLPPMDTGTVWKAGGTAEVVFAIKFNVSLSLRGLSKESRLAIVQHSLRVHRSSTKLPLCCVTTALHCGVYCVVLRCTALHCVLRDVYAC